MNRIVKGDLIDHIAGTIPNFPKKDAAAVIDRLLSFISDEVAAGNEVAIKGFGSFKPRQWPERLGRNPATGAAITIPASTTMGFRAAKAKPTV